MIGERLALPRGIEPYFSLERAAPRGGGDDLELVIGGRRDGRMSFKDSILPAPDQWWQIELPRVPARVSTVGLHRPNPVAREMPGFVGFFARQGSLAEREGFSAPLRDPRKTEVRSTFSGQPTWVVCTGSMYRN